MPRKSLPAVVLLLQSHAQQKHPHRAVQEEDALPEKIVYGMGRVHYRALAVFAVLIKSYNDTTSGAVQARPNKRTDRCACFAAIANRIGSTSARLIKVISAPPRPAEKTILCARSSAISTNGCAR